MGAELAREGALKNAKSFAGKLRSHRGMGFHSEMWGEAGTDSNVVEPPGFHGGFGGASALDR
ncbi:hypothetical protein GC387_19565 [Pseudomonas sp. MWU12-2323]|nr:hypothetical protein [Pseudomonas sp. MWU12-2323]